MTDNHLCQTFCRVLSHDAVATCGDFSQVVPLISRSVAIPRPPRPTTDIKRSLNPAQPIAEEMSARFSSFISSDSGAVTCVPQPSADRPDLSLRWRLCSSYPRANLRLRQLQPNLPPSRSKKRATPSKRSRLTTIPLRP